MGAGVRDRTTHGAAVLVVVALLVTLVAAPPAIPDPDPPIDPYAPHEPQTVCDPAPKPGVVAFAELLLEAYPVSGSSGISRECGVRGRSEHKEGRAFDWAVSVDNPQQRTAAEEALATLLATDDDGNRHALFRRFGIMYMIWDRQIFSASQADQGWRPYPCSSTASYDSCHVHHVHFSFSRDGAEMRTSWWLQQQQQPERAKDAKRDVTIERAVARDPVSIAIEFAQSAFPTNGSTDEVFVASADDPHDAMTASVLAGATHGAVLLTSRTERLERRVDAELSRVMSADATITLVGDAETLPDALVADAARRGGVDRIAGLTAAATARAAARTMQSNHPASTAIVVGLGALDQALPMVAVAAANDWPVVFTARDALGADARAVLGNGDIEHVYVAGGTSAVSTIAERQIRALDGVTAERVSGKAPRADAITVAREFFAIPSAYAVVDRDDPALASVVAAYAGERRHAPVLVTDGDTIGARATRYMSNSAGPETAVILAGGEATISRQIERDVRRALR